MKKILIVDDKEVVEAFRDLLSERYDVAIAWTGEEGIEIFKVFKPDLTIINFLMPPPERVNEPFMDGVEFTREIKKLDPSAKVISISAFSKLRGDEMLEAGAEEVVEKPLWKKELFEIVEKHLGSE